MKKLTILVATLLVLASSFSFAETQAKSLALNSPKSGPTLKDLTAAWKNQQYMHAAKQDPKNDITIVYGGADISNRPALRLHTTVV